MITQRGKKDARFSYLGQARRMWFISAIHGNVPPLYAIHDEIINHIQTGDRIIYAGNAIGYGEHSVDVINEMLHFRRAVLAKPGMIPSDVIYLRGAQEELLQKVTQLQFAPEPTKTLLWMYENGLTATLQSYGIPPEEGIIACKQGIIGISKWTQKIRDTVKSHPGHECLNTNLVRAAIFDANPAYRMLFVNAGIDTQKPLGEQQDNFWWAAKKFDEFETPYTPFAKVIRGYDPEHKGTEYNCIKATIDGACGFGGALTCSGFSYSGDVFDQITCH